MEKVNRDNVAKCRKSGPGGRERQTGEAPFKHGLLDGARGELEGAAASAISDYTYKTTHSGSWSCHFSLNALFSRFDKTHGPI